MFTSSAVAVTPVGSAGGSRRMISTSPDQGLSPPSLWALDAQVVGHVAGCVGQPVAGLAFRQQRALGVGCVSNPMTDGVAADVDRVGTRPGQHYVVAVELRRGRSAGLLPA